VRLALCRLTPLTSSFKGHQGLATVTHEPVQLNKEPRVSVCICSNAREAANRSLTPRGPQIAHVLSRKFTNHKRYAHTAYAATHDPVYNPPRNLQDRAYACDRAMRTTQPSPTCMMNSRKGRWCCMCTSSYALLASSLLYA